MENPNTPVEGEITKSIENETAKIPSAIYLGAALTSVGASIVLKMMGKDHLALFVGQWVAPFLLLGIYNKIVKTEGNG